MDSLAAAWAYAVAGYPVFPCDPSNKAPKTANGFKSAMTDLEIVETWFDGQDALVGMPIPEGLVVIDVDDETVPEWLQGVQTVIAKTPHGWHYWFRADHPSNSKGSLRFRGDVRGAGKGYVIVPSDPEAGYFWWGPGIHEATPAPLPQAIAEALRAAPTIPRTTTNPSRYPLTDRIKVAREKLRDHGPAVERLRGGCRCCSGGDEHTAKAAFIVVNDCAVDDPNLAFEVLHEWNMACDPPWPDAGLWSKLASADRNAQHDYGGGLIRLWAEKVLAPPTKRKAKEAYDEWKDKTPTPDQWKEVAKSVSARGEMGRIFQEIMNLRDKDTKAALAAAGEFVPDIAHGDGAQLAKQLAESYRAPDGTPIASEWGKIWRYQPDSGIWAEVPRPEMVHRLSGWSGLLKSDGKPLRLSGTNEILDLLLSWPVEYGQCDGWLSAGRGVAFADCCIEATQTELQAHPPQPGNRATSGYRFNLSDRRDPKLFRSYLDSLWSGEADQEEREALLQEFIGAALFQLAPRYHKAMVLYGPAGTGKSTFLTIIEGLFPQGTVAHVDPQRFDNDNQLGALINKRLNTVHELPSKHILGLERVKTVIDGAPVPVDQKYQRIVTFQPTAAHLFAANNLPQVADIHPSFWDRFLILELTRRFRATQDEDMHMATKILRHEIPGVVAWAVEGAERLLAQQRFTEPPSSKAAMERWQRSANATGMFVEEWCELNPDTWTTSQDLMSAFSRYCRLNGHKQPSSRTFGQHLQQVPGVEKRHAREGNQYNLLVTGDPLKPRTN